MWWRERSFHMFHVDVTVGAVGGHVAIHLHQVDRSVARLRVQIAMQALRADSAIRRPQPRGAQAFFDTDRGRWDVVTRSM